MGRQPSSSLIFAAAVPWSSSRTTSPGPGRGPDHAPDRHLRCHLGSLIGLLLEAAIMVDLKKGSLVRIETHGKLGPPRGVLKWMITAKLAKVE